MSKDGITRAQANRAIRQEALRAQLENQGHIQHVSDLVDKIKNPDEVIDDHMLGRYKIAIDAKLRLVNKYLPDLKATEVSGVDGGPIMVSALTKEEAEKISKELEDKY